MATLKMGIDPGGFGFFLERHAHDLGPLQYIRELNQNAIEAIGKAKRERGRIVWSFDERIYRAEGVKKLCITDNGCGMTGDEMALHINNLSSSGGRQALDGNYGIGAKISAAPRNHAGITYQSWLDGVGSMIRLWRDRDGDYGLMEFEHENGSEHVVRLREAAIEEHEVIAGARSGTHVVLHGMTDLEDTFSSNAAVASRKPGQWVRRYLNTRYFRLPANVEIACRTAGGGDEQFRYVTGQGPMLDAIMLNSGTVQLQDAIAYWWILPKGDLRSPIRLGGSPKDITTLATLGPGYDVTGHIAAIFQNELHDTFRGNPARVLLQQFGIVFGYEQVAIYIEPRAAGTAPNMARTSILIGGAPLPWSEWADEFRAKLPKGIREFMDQIQPAAHDTKSEDERILSVMDLYTDTKYKLTPNGDLRVGPPTIGGNSTPVNPRPRGPGGGGGGGNGGRKGTAAYSELIDPSGARGTEAHPKQDLPNVIFVSQESREKLSAFFGESIANSVIERPGDMYPNQAGWFAAPNTVNLNLDFGALRNLIDRFARDYPATRVTRAAVSETVLSWWSQTLKEAVQGLRGLAASRVWSREEVGRSLEGDSSAGLLTAAVMPRYLVFQAMKREIRGRLGKVQGQESSAAE